MLPLDPLIVVLAAAALGGFVQGLSGFGFSLVAVGIWAWVLPPGVIGPLAVACSLLAQIMGVGSIRHGFDLRRIWPFLAGGLAGVPLGTALLSHVASDPFKAVVGLFLVLWSATSLLLRDIPALTRGGRLADAAAGLAGGIMGGLGGITGPVPTLWCILRRWDKQAQRSVIQSFNLSMLALTLGIYAASGLITSGAIRLFAYAAPVMLLPTLLGIQLYRRLGDLGFRRILLLLLLASGAILLANALPHLT